MTVLRAKLVDSILVVAIAASVLLISLAIFGSGVYSTPFGIRVSSQTLWRPAAVASAAIALWLYASDSRQQRLAGIWHQVLRHSTLVAILLALLTVGIALRVSTFEALGADAYGYISQAHLWAAGNLVQHEPLALRVPWPEADWTFSPLGYRPGLDRGTIVPTYAPGLPLFMAGLFLLFGQIGPFLAVPLLGGVTVFAAFLLARRAAGEACGLATAALLLTSPVFLFQLKEPMSDVPVTGLWLLAILFASRTAPAFIFLGGLVTSAAILTRPNLVPLAAVLGSLVLLCSATTLRQRLLNAALFSAGAIPGCAAVAVVNQRLYGSALSSGYGDMSLLFRPEYFWTNLSQYSAWLIGMETPFILLAPIGWWWLSSQREFSNRESHDVSTRTLSHVFVVFALVLYACYAVYVPFDDWTFLRFLLPAIALLLLLCSVVITKAGRRSRSFPQGFLLVSSLVVFLAWRWDQSGLKAPEPHDRRFAVVGEYVERNLPPNAILFSLVHSGSIRYYSGRLTLRWDWLPEEWLDRSVTFLKANGYQPFLLIEQGWERQRFVDRFSGHSRIGSLSFTPMATYIGPHDRADLYDLGNPDRPVSTAKIQHIPTDGHTERSAH